MSGSVNKVILVGHLGGHPEVRRTQDGRPVVTFSMATSETWRDKATAERREATEWHRVVIFNEGLTKVAEHYLKKGSKVYIEGQQKTRKWQAQDGSDRYTTEVVIAAFRGQLVLLDRAERAPEASDENGYGQAPDAGRVAADAAAKPSTRDALNDDIPF